MRRPSDFPVGTLFCACARTGLILSARGFSREIYWIADKADANFSPWVGKWMLNSLEQLTTWQLSPDGKES